MNAEENARLSLAGPGTPGGDFMRRYCIAGQGVYGRRPGHMGETRGSTEAHAARALARVHIGLLARGAPTIRRHDRPG